MGLFSFLSYFLFWGLFLSVGYGCISSCGGKSPEAAIYKMNPEVPLLPVKQKDGQSPF